MVRLLQITNLRPTHQASKKLIQQMEAQVAAEKKTRLPNLQTVSSFPIFNNRLNQAEVKELLDRKNLVHALNFQTKMLDYPNKQPIPKLIEEMLLLEKYHRVLHLSKISNRLVRKV